MKNYRKESKKISKTIILLLFAINAMCVSVSAQMRIKSSTEFSIYGGGGYSFFHYKSVRSGVHGISSGGFGANFGASFTGFFNENLGYNIGLGFGMNGVKILVDSITFITPDFDNASSLYGKDQPYDLCTTLSGYKEKQNIYFLTIPVMLHFQTTPATSQKSEIRKSFYAMVGAKLNILIKSQYTAEVKELKNVAYFTQLGNWAGTQKFAGLGRFKGNSSNGKFVSIMPVFTFETGIKWYSSNKMNYYIGAYFDCGLSEPTKNDRKPVNNYISAERLADLSLLQFYNKSFLMEFGVKLRLAFLYYPKCMPCR